MLRRLTGSRRWRAVLVLAVAYALSTMARPAALAFMGAARIVDALPSDHRPAATGMHHHHGKTHHAGVHQHPDGAVHHHRDQAGSVAAGDQPSSPCCGLLALAGVPPHDGPVLCNALRTSRAASAAEDLLVGCGPDEFDHPPTVLLS